MFDLKQKLANNLIDAYKDGYKDGLKAGGMNWVPVDRALPVKGKPVIAAFDDNTVEGIGWQSWAEPDDDFDPFLYFTMFDEEHQTYNAHTVTHWMYMPNHPSEEEE